MIISAMVISPPSLSTLAHSFFFYVIFTLLLPASEDRLAGFLAVGPMLAMSGLILMTARFFPI